jgi:hypothetical protein
MELLREFIDIASNVGNQYMLFEDLGNFKKVRPEFVKIFKDSKYIKGKNDAYGRTVFGAGGLRKSVGQNSEFETTIIKTGVQAIEQLSQPNAVGMVITTGTNVKDQVFALFFTSRYHDANSDEFDKRSKCLIALDTAYLKERLPQTFETMKSKGDISWSVSSNGLEIKEREETLAKCRGFITAFLKAIKTEQPDVKAFVIFRDTARDSLQGERAEAKRGRILTPKEIAQLEPKDRKIYEASFKRELAAKLSKLKSNKAVNVSTPEEFLKVILEQGYIDKIKVNGITYERSRDSFNLGKLIDGSSDSWYDSYLEYDINYDEKFNRDDTQFWALRNEASEKSGLAAIRARIKNGETVPEEEHEKALDVYAKLAPPETIRIKFKLEKSSIVPGEIQFMRR